MLPERLPAGPGWTFVGGKGGVGKTTVAGLLAVALADSGARVLVLSTDPAHSLGDALGAQLGPDPAPVPDAPGLEALEVDAERERARFLERHREALIRLAERGTYLERDDVAGFLDLALPGMDELAAVLRLLELAEADPALHVIVDTAPTGHTLRLLDLPRAAGGWIAALEAAEDRHREVSLALAGAYRPDEAARCLAALRSGVDRLASLLRDPARARFVLVSTPEPVIAAETRRYLAALRARGVAVAAVAVNRVPDGGASPAPDLGPEGAGVPVVAIPLLAGDPAGVHELRALAASLRPLAPEEGASPGPSCRTWQGGKPTGRWGAPEESVCLSPRSGRVTHLRRGLPPPTSLTEPPDPISVGAPWFAPPDRSLYLVGGKGGVGKSTVASALAARLAEEARAPVLLMSTDPAGSLGDVWEAHVGPDPVPAPGAPGVGLRQVDAEAAWNAFRESVPDGGPAAADREVIRRLVETAPPGVDEVAALADVIDLLERGEYNALVLDTAPTGHLLRLLEMPSVALDWSHALLRLLLRYREVTGLGETAERVLRFSRTLRGLRARLEDRAHTWVLAVALPEALSVPETARLAARLDGLGVAPGALLVNRLLADGGVLPGRAAEAAALLALPGFPQTAAAPELGGGPRGAAELLRFARAWRRVAPA